MNWERIEPVAESFGDLDPRLDLREADVADGAAWTGWHTIEKDLWPPAEGYTPLTQDERVALADQLVADTDDLNTRVQDLDVHRDAARQRRQRTPRRGRHGQDHRRGRSVVAHGPVGLPGQRRRCHASRSKPSSRRCRQRIQSSPQTITERFATLQALLDEQRDGEGFVLYTELTPDQVKQLSDAVNALQRAVGEPHLSGRSVTFSRRRFITVAGASTAGAATLALGGSLSGCGLTSDGAPRGGEQRRRRVLRAAPGRHHHAGAGPSAFRRVRPHHGVSRRGHRAAHRLDRRRGEDDQGPGRRRVRSDGWSDRRSATGHRRGVRPPACSTHDHHRLRSGDVRGRRRQRPVRSGGSPSGRAATAPPLLGRQPRPCEVRGRPVRPSMFGRSPGRRPCDTQPRPDRVRHRRGQVVAARFRAHVIDQRCPADAAESVRVQRRHEQREGGTRGPRRRVRLGRSGRRRQQRLAGRGQLPRRPAHQDADRNVGPDPSRRAGDASSAATRRREHRCPAATSSPRPTSR